VATELEIKTAIGAGFFVHDFLRTQGGINFDSFVQRVGAFIEFTGAGRFNRSARALSGMAAVRGAYNNAVNTGPSWLTPLLQEYSEILDFPDRDTLRIMQALYADYVKTGKRVKSRQFTFGSVVASGSPVGSGTIYRCTKDENDFDIENTFVQVITVECVQDQNSGGTKFKESFRFKGGSANIDNIVIGGSDSDETFSGISSDDSSGFFQNCSFSSMNGSGVSKFDGWTLDVDSLAAWTQDLVNYYQITPGDPVAASLKASGNGNIYQAFSRGNTQFPQTSPMLIRVPYNRSIGAANAGTLIRLRCGEQVKNITLAAESGWRDELRIEFSNRAWYKQFAKDGGRIQIEVHGLTSGYILFDNVLVAPFQPFDGLWYAPCAGATPFKVGDTYTFTDTAVDAAINQRFLVQYTGVYLPHSANASAITWAEPVFTT
jgi:hypothetical protein